MRIERMYERNSVMARAPVGIVQTYFSGSVPVVRGTFRIKLNHYNLGSASHARGKDVNYWAGVIAHELLHNLGHTHPHGKYHQLFIREYQNAIRYNALNQFSTRYLRISNRSRQSMTVYVKVRQLGKQIWYWFPSQGMLKYRLAPGQSILVTRNGSKIPASRARIFAHGSRGTQWNKYRNRDLLLVKKSYQARARGMFNYTLKD